MNKIPLIRDLLVAVFCVSIFFIFYPYFKVDFKSKENLNAAIGVYFYCGNDTTKVIEVANDYVQTLDKKGNRNAFKVGEFFKKYERLK